MQREHLVNLAVSFAALLTASVGAGAASTRAITLYFDDQSHYEREINPGEVHPYVITLKAGEFVRFVARPAGINIALTFESPAGKQLSKVDQRNQTVYPETLSAVAETDGRYRLLVTSDWSRSGGYQVRVDERRVAVPQDHDRVEAERVWIEADEQRVRGDAESLRAAEQGYTRALALWRSVHDDAGTVEALNDIGNVRGFLGHPQQALSAFLEALTLQQCLPHNEPRTDILNNIAVALQDLGQDRYSLGYSEAAVRAAADARQTAFSVYNTAQTYLKLGEGRTALQLFLRALEATEQTGERLTQARTLRNVGDAYSRLGEWREALLHYGRALTIQRAIRDRLGESYTLLAIGLLYENWGDHGRALDHYQKALTLGEEIRNQRVQAIALHRMGNVHQTRGEPARAISAYDQALKLYREAPYRSDEATVLAGIGRAHAEKGEFSAALRYFREALGVSRERVQRGFILNAIAGAQSSSVQPDEAIASANEAIDIFRPAGHQQGEAEALYARARANVAAGNLDQARSDAEASLRLIEKLRANISTFEARALFLASYSDVSELHIRVLMQLHKEHPSGRFSALALDVSERVRARTLIDYLSESPITGENSEQRALLKRHREIRSLLSAKAEAQLKAMGRTNSQDLAANMGREMDELNVEFDQIAARLRTTSPRTAAINDAESVAVQTIQRQVVDSRTALLEYFLGEEKSFLWVVTPSTLREYELPSRSVIEAAVRDAYESLATPGKSRDGLAPMTRMILAPAIRDLKATRLLIVSDGALQYLPFAALPSPRDPSRPLIADFEIVNIPSASTIAFLRRETRPSAARKTLVVFADPVFDRNDERVRTGGRAAKVDENAIDSDVVRSAKDTGLADGLLPRLPFTRREANALIEFVPAERRKVALDFNASRQTALASDLRNYRIVHFATHGLLNSQRPELSGIVLSMVDEKGSEQRGFLAVADVFNMSLRADLVVLSGCRTALGKEVKGEGISGLTRAFMYAGAPRVVASVWKVSDAATAELMKRFYAGMLGPGKLSPAAALRAAQLSLYGEKRWNDAYYWAAFVIQGDWN